MEPKVLKCSLCGATRSYKFALKLHQRSEHGPSSKTASACPVAATKVATSQPRTEQTCKVTQKSKPRHGSYRAVIHQTVHQLLARHRRHSSYFRKSSAEIAEDLQRSTRDHKFDRVVYFAIAVTAKVFAGGKYVPCASGRPRLEVPTVAQLAETARPPCIYPVTTPAAVVQGVCRRGRRGHPSLDPVRRVLFRSMDTASANVPPAPDVHGHREDDEDWRMNIWDSYVTQRIKPPSPMGYRWAPATIFSSSSAAELPTTPLAADHVVWGPDLPNEPLEEDTVPEVPGWPVPGERHSSRS